MNTKGLSRKEPIWGGGTCTVHIQNELQIQHMELMSYNNRIAIFCSSISCVKLRYVSHVRAPAHYQGGVSRECVSYVAFAKMKRSKPSGAQGRKRRKEEEEKKAKYRGKSSHLSH